MSLDAWKSVADWATIIAIAFTVASGSTAIILGQRINDRQADQLRNLNSNLTATRTELEEEKQKTAVAQKESAEAQLALHQYIDRVARKQGFRRIDREPFLKELKDKPKGKAEVRYKAGDSEAYFFARNIEAMLREAGWIVSTPASFSEEISKGGMENESGIRIGARDADESARPESLLHALGGAIGFGMGGMVGISFFSDPLLPPETFIILVGQKP